MKLARDYIQSELDKGYPVTILGYSLGKTQLLNHSIGDLCNRRYSSKAIWEMEQVHREMGLQLYETDLFPTANDKWMLKGIPWLLFYNHSSISDVLLRKLKQ